VTVPLRVPRPDPDPSPARVRPSGLGARIRRRVGRWGRVGVERLSRPARLLPGVGAIGCAVAGSWLLWGLGWALLVAAGFCLALDLRTPRG
jgi:hypothetical protein